MASKLGSISINDLSLIQTDSDPSTGAGLEAEIGSICFINIAGSPFFQKFDLGVTDWIPMIGRSFAQYSNTEINQNLNSDEDPSFTTKVNLLGTELYLSDDFTKSGEDLICNFDGFVIAIVNLHIWSTATRPAPQSRLKKNNVLIGPIGSTGYIRDSSGHQESSLHIYTIIPVSDGDTISTHTRREASTGTVNLNSVGTSEIILMRY